MSSSNALSVLITVNSPDPPKDCIDLPNTQKKKKRIKNKNKKALLFTIRLILN